MHRPVHGRACPTRAKHGQDRTNTNTRACTLPGRPRRFLALLRGDHRAAHPAAAPALRILPRHLRRAVDLKRSRILAAGVALPAVHTRQRSNICVNSSHLSCTRQPKASLAWLVTATTPSPQSASALPGRQQPSAPIMLRVRSLLAAHRPLHLSRSAARFAQGWKGMQTLCHPCAHTVRWSGSQIWLGEGSLGVETVDALLPTVSAAACVRGVSA